MTDRQTYQLDPERMANAAVDGLLTRDGAGTVATMLAQAAVAVALHGWLRRRLGRGGAIAVTFLLYAAGQSLTRGFLWIARDVAAQDAEVNGLKVPPWATLTRDERRQLLGGIAERIRTT